MSEPGVPSQSTTTSSPRHFKAPDLYHQYHLHLFPHPLLTAYPAMFPPTQLSPLLPIGITLRKVPREGRAYSFGQWLHFQISFTRPFSGSFVLVNSFQTPFVSRRGILETLFNFVVISSFWQKQKVCICGLRMCFA